MVGVTDGWTDPLDPANPLHLVFWAHCPLLGDSRAICPSIPTPSNMLEGDHGVAAGAALSIDGEKAVMAMPT